MMELFSAFFELAFHAIVHLLGGFVTGVVSLLYPPVTERMRSLRHWVIACLLVSIVLLCGGVALLGFGKWWPGLALIAAAVGTMWLAGRFGLMIEEESKRARG